VVGIVLHTIARRFQELDYQLKVLGLESRGEKKSRIRLGDG